MRRRTSARAEEQRPGEVAARAFELFRDGKGFRDVVIDLRQTPERVRQLHREYALGSDLLVPAAVRKSIEELGFAEEGRTLGAQDLLQVVQRLADANRRLIQKTIDQAQQFEQLRQTAEPSRTIANPVESAGTAASKAEMVRDVGTSTICE